MCTSARVCASPENLIIEDVCMLVRVSAQAHSGIWGFFLWLGIYLFVHKYVGRSVCICVIYEMLFISMWLRRSACARYPVRVSIFHCSCTESKAMVCDRHSHVSWCH